MKRLLLSCALILVGLQYLPKHLIRPSKQKPVKREDQENPSSNHQDVSARQQNKRTMDNSPLAQPVPNEQQWRDEQKQGWERQIRTAENLNRITVVGAVVAILALGGVIWQSRSAHIAAEAAKISADIANETLVASRRPWVSVEIIDHEGVEIDKTFRFAFRLKNYGSTPAVSVFISPTGVLWQPGGDDPAARQKDICEATFDGQPVGFGPFTLTPNQEHVESAGMDLFSKDAVTKSLAAGPHANSIAIFPHIMGCVRYKSTFDSSIHKTPFNVQITRKPSKSVKDNSPELLAIRTDIGPIPANLISLRSMNWHSGIQPD